MSTDLPAMRRFKNEFLAVASRPFAAWLATELADALGDQTFSASPDLGRLVADVEAEGSALIGALPCPMPHGKEDPEGNVVPEYWLLFSVCPTCGAAL